MFFAVLGAAALGQQVTFAEIEKAKYEAMASTQGFSGRYDVVTLPSGLRQSVYLWANEGARRIKVTAEGNPVVESAWTKDRKWLVNYGTRQYKDDSKSGGFSLADPYKPLVSEPGRANFGVTEMGVRFAADPEPKVTSDAPVTEDGRKLRRIEAEGDNPQSKGTIKIVQLFDEKTWIVRRFSLEIIANGKQMLKVNGFLKDDKVGSAVKVDLALPGGVAGSFQRVSGG